MKTRHQSDLAGAAEDLRIWGIVLSCSIIILAVLLTVGKPWLNLLDAQRACSNEGWDYAYINLNGDAYCGPDASNETGSGTGVVSLRSVQAVSELFGSPAK